MILVEFAETGVLPNVRKIKPSEIQAFKCKKTIRRKPAK